jgi:hypothetical protein
MDRAGLTGRRESVLLYAADRSSAWRPMEFFGCLGFAEGWVRGWRYQKRRLSSSQEKEKKGISVKKLLIFNRMESIDPAKN